MAQPGSALAWGARGRRFESSRSDHFYIFENSVISMTEKKYNFIYVTCQDQSEAKGLAKHLLDKKLIACANIMPPHIAMYEWEGEVVEGTETVMILKTCASLFHAVRDEIIKQHSYDCPCILSFDVDHGHQPFLDWIESAVRA